MTSPEDDDRLEEALRRALSEAASEVEPDSDGLDKIHQRIAGRPPRPWLVSVFFGVVERVRNWTWRGHWAWPDWLSRLAEDRWPHLRRGSFPGRGLGSVRLAAVLTGIALIAGVAFGVQPLREAILQTSPALDSDNGSPSVAAGAQGNGTRSNASGNGTPSSERPSAGGPRTNTGKAPNAGRAPGIPKSHSSASGKCESKGSSAVDDRLSSLTVAPTSPSATEPPVQTVSITDTPAPVYTDTSVATCPVTSPAKSPTPTPTPTPTSTDGGSSAGDGDSSYSDSGDGYSSYSDSGDGDSTGSDTATGTPTATGYPRPSGYQGPPGYGQPRGRPVGPVRPATGYILIRPQVMIGTAAPGFR